MMANDGLALLVRLSIAGTVALLIIALLRAPARRGVGPEAAFWLWLLVPASLIGALLPRATPSFVNAGPFVGPPRISVIELPVHFTPASADTNYAFLAALLWLVGVTGALVYFAYCQRVLKRSLGVLLPGPEGAYWSSTAQQPMLIGGWHSRI